MKFDEFRYRYFLITKSELRNQKTKCVNLIGEDLYNEYIEVLKEKPYDMHDYSAIIVDLLKKEVIAVFMTSDKSYVLNEKYSDLKHFEEFKVSNQIAYNQNVIQMRSIEQKIIGTYAIDGVWSLIHYVTSNNKHRVLLNKNAFGRFSLFNTRDYKIHKLLED